jgi:branched-chain amino acid transport system ATP-binding protein
MSISEEPSIGDGESLLMVDDLQAGYGRIPIVRGVDLKVDAGDSVAIVGPNGAGKTTLLRTLTGLLKPQGGRVKWLGQRATGRSAHWLAKNGLVHVPEGAGGFPDMTVRENLEIPLHALGRRPQPADFNRVYEIFPVLQSRARQLAGTLSGGEQRMLAIGRGLILRPLAIFLDEPSLGLAPVLVRRVGEALKLLNKAGTTILVSEQNLVLAQEVTRRAHLMSRGAFVWSGSSDQLRSADAVRHAVLGVGLSGEAE